MNLSAIERLELFNVKMEELKTLFANEPLQKLKTLSFQFEEVKKIKKKKSKKVKLKIWMNQLVKLLLISKKIIMLKLQLNNYVIYKFYCDIFYNNVWFN